MLPLNRYLLSSPNGIRTGVATSRKRGGMSIEEWPTRPMPCAPTFIDMVQPRVSRFGESNSEQTEPHPWAVADLTGRAPLRGADGLKSSRCCPSSAAISRPARRLESPLGRPKGPPVTTDKFEGERHP